MKKLYCIACLATTFFFAATLKSLAQDEPRVRNANLNETIAVDKGFKKQNLFTGGGLTASFYNGGSLLGVNPILGYKLNDYLDAGVVLNYVFSGSRDVSEYNDKYRQHVFGPGVFGRVYPVSFLFFQAQLEENFTNIGYTKAGSSRPVDKYSANATSLLLGGGYSTGRAKGSTTFFYLSILADVLKNRNSPYVELSSDPVTRVERVRIIPVIRAGVNVGLFQKRYGYYE
ncbi:MAG TPA: hypothetical protein PKY86_01510 [Niabella sp.]|nr:hypothetical protein [Niabella sp.]HQW14230.1 hypothetical protein [Niabella sp.]HQX19630.1 hypothetical protein [Niabella sp.]HQX39936.1 hypothetical protein [Niabella sp.]HRB06929.1 hypothetical protein [Niabella sp.]